MPLEHASEGSAGFKKNIKTEMGAGKPQRQAVAIAYKEAGDAEAEQQAGPLKEPAEPSEGFGGVVDALMGMAGDESEEDREGEKNEPQVHDSAGIIFVAPNGRVLFLRRDSQANHGGTWDWPGGHLKPGETLIEGAIRESHEECGYLAPAGKIREMSRAITEDMDFTTFICPVETMFTPDISRDEFGHREHDNWLWADPRDPPEPLHPGIEEVLSNPMIEEIIGKGGVDPKEVAAAAEDSAKWDKIAAAFDEMKADAPGVYVRRNLTAKSAADFAKWADAQGFTNLTPADELHATIVYSRKPLDWTEAKDAVTVKAGKRTVEPLGDKGAVVLKFESSDLRERWQEARDLGASWDFPGYHPHVTITYDAGGKGLDDVEPYAGDLIFGPEIEEALNENWAEEKGYRATADDAEWAPLIAAMDAMRDDALLLSFDKASVREYDVDGRLHVALTPISKAAVNPYLGAEIPGYEELGLDPKKVYRLLRPPEELAKAADSFNGIPVLSEHIPTNALDHPFEDVIGSTGTDAIFSDPYLMQSLSIWPSADIEGIEDDSKREISSSYRYTPVIKSGVFRGDPFDIIMTDIVGNHCAIVTLGRAGGDVLVADSIMIDPSEREWELLADALASL